MAPSRRRIVFAWASALFMPMTILACNSIIGLSDYDRVQCTGGVCDGGLFPDSPFDVQSTDAGADVARVDAAGAKPVQWANWKMPNYVPTGAEAGTTDNPTAYEAATDGIRDKVTGLVWEQQRPDAQNKTYADALKSCPTGFRLPSRIELVTLLDHSRSGAKIDPIFTGSLPSAYWSSSEVRAILPGQSQPTAVDPPQFWVVDFAQGGVGKTDASNLAHVRCVKGAAQ